jgi:hypothetical protein
MVEPVEMVQMVEMVWMVEMVHGARFTIQGSRFRVQGSRKIECLKWFIETNQVIG